MTNTILTNKNFRALTSQDVFGSVVCICDMLVSAGARPFLVGGCVRDAILNIPLSDFDIEVFGITFQKLEKILSKKFSIELTGKSFCVLKLCDFPIDISVPRAETKFGDKHSEFHTSIMKDCDVADAARRRDFTINAIYYDLENQRLIDIFDGVNDLRHGRLRHVSDKFSEDPLRVLRGMQFAGRFGLRAVDDTIQLCRKLSMEHISQERIFCEWQKLIIKSKKPSFGLRFLKAVEWLKFFPEIAHIAACEQDPIRHPEGTVFEHTCLSLDAYAKMRSGNAHDDIVLGFATLCHDFGKPYVTSEDEHGIHHYGHDKAGIGPAKSFLSAIGTPNQIVRDVIPLVECHMTPRNLYRDNRNDASILRLANAVGRIDLLLKLCYADFVGRTNWEKTYDSNVGDWMRETAVRLGVLKTKPKPIIGGKDLIKLGLSPSSKFSEILNICFNAQLAGEIVDKPSGCAFLKKILPRES